MRKILTTLLLLCLLLTACQRGAKEQTHLVVTVTIEPLRWFVEQIGDTLIEVNTIVPSGSSPETYEPTPRQMVSLADSRLYIKVGCIGFETTWMDKLKANAPHMDVADASQGVQYAESSDGVRDPHTWTSCTNARIIARNICNALTLQDPVHKAHYKRNLQTLLHRIDETDRAIRQSLVSHRQRSFVIYHPALTYFARDYGLLQLPMEEEGREPNAASMAHLIERAREIHVQTIFVQREFSPRNTVAIRNATGAKPVEIDPLAYDWPTQMTTIANHLR